MTTLPATFNPSRPGPSWPMIFSHDVVNVALADGPGELGDGVVVDPTPVGVVGVSAPSAPPLEQAAVMPSATTTTLKPDQRIPIMQRSWLRGRRHVNSFWSTLKTEYYDRHTFTTRADAIAAVSSWIENVYNRRRRHSALGQTSPAAFERRLTTAAAEAA